VVAAEEEVGGASVCDGFLAQRRNRRRCLPRTGAGGERTLAEVELRERGDMGAQQSIVPAPDVVGEMAMEPASTTGNIPVPGPSPYVLTPPAPPNLACPDPNPLLAEIDMLNARVAKLEADVIELKLYVASKEFKFGGGEVSEDMRHHAELATSRKGPAPSIVSVVVNAGGSLGGGGGIVVTSPLPTVPSPTGGASPLPMVPLPTSSFLPTPPTPAPSLPPTAPSLLPATPATFIVHAAVGAGSGGGGGAVAPSPLPVAPSPFPAAPRAHLIIEPAVVSAGSSGGTAAPSPLLAPLSNDGDAPKIEALRAVSHASSIVPPSPPNSYDHLPLAGA
jgi:hypothetical protein